MSSGSLSRRYAKAVMQLGESTNSTAKLGSEDIAVLRALASGEAPNINSHHRLHLELLGLVRDGPRGAA